MLSPEYVSVFPIVRFCFPQSTYQFSSDYVPVFLRVRFGFPQSTFLFSPEYVSVFPRVRFCFPQSTFLFFQSTFLFCILARMCNELIKINIIDN